jgi:hypothetical protein
MMTGMIMQSELVVRALGRHVVPAPRSLAMGDRSHALRFDDPAIEQDLAACGLGLPLSHRAAWRDAGLAEGWLVSARDGEASPEAALWVELRPTRALPLHRIARSERVGAALTIDGLLAALSAAAEAVTTSGDVLRCEVATFHRDPAIRERIGAHLRGLGFTPAAEMQGYRFTSAVDLRPEEDAVLASLHRTARRHIRAVEKNPVVLAPVEPRHAAAVEALVRETRARTGGHFTQKPWERLIAFGEDHPKLMRWVGLFHAETGELLAFASGHHHGDHATYADAGSTRRDDVKFPMGYGLLWDLIRWAKREGATWFDFGGITDGSHGDGRDPVGGISDFKRYFQGQELEVGDEWIFEPHPRRAQLARAVSSLAARARSLRTRS